MAESKRTVKLKTSDDQIFEVDEAVASESVLVKDHISAMHSPYGADNEPIPLINVSSKILPMVIQYCKYHLEKRERISEADKSVIEVEDFFKALWDAAFIKKFDQQTLVDLLLAANFLNIPNLVDLACQTVADMMKGITVEEVRKTFKIENDLTPEEEAVIRKENQWAFD